MTTIDVPADVAGFQPIYTYANGINDAGQIVGTFAGADRLPHGFEFSNGHYVVLDPPGSVGFSVNGINNKGDIVGSIGDAGIVRSYLYANGVFLTLDFPGSFGIVPTAVNDSDQVGGLIGAYDGFLYSNGAFQLLHIPGARNTYPHGINNAGTITADSNGAGGFFDSSGAFTILRVPGVSVVAPQDINDLGQMVGLFAYPNGPPQPFLATPVPEPASLLLAALAILLGLILSLFRKMRYSFACSLSWLWKSSGNTAKTCSHLPPSATV